MAQGPRLSPRAYTIATYALCGFSNLGQPVFAPSLNVIVTLRYAYFVQQVL